MSERNYDHSDASCPARADVLAALGGDALSASRARLEAHLAHCEACRVEVEALRETLAVLDEDRRAETRRAARDSAPAAARLRSALAMQRRRELRRGLAACLVLLAGCAVALTLGPRSLERLEAPLASPASAAAGAERLAVEWLLRSQDEDGLWRAARWGGDERYDIGLSGLGLLALARAGNADGSGEALARARARFVRGVVDLQGADGLIGPSFFGAPYNHGIATVALLEAGAGDITAREAADRAVDWVRAAQRPDGGWGYYGRDGTNSALSFWPLVALLRARESGRDDLAAPIERGFAWLRALSDASGRVAYSRGVSTDPSTVRTAKALLCASAPRAGDVVALRRRWEDGLLRALASDAPQTYYGDFIVRSALAGAERRAIGDASRALGAAPMELRERQTLSGPERGSWPATDEFGPLGGRVYATASALLTLQASTAEGGFWRG